MGEAVHPGPHDLLDGDLRPVIDPQAMFTSCLEWLGAADVEPDPG